MKSYNAKQKLYTNIYIHIPLMITKCLIMKNNNYIQIYIYIHISLMITKSFLQPKTNRKDNTENVRIIYNKKKCRLMSTPQMLLTI